MGVGVKNWHKFQHFKDRRPPWIKLYRDILDDMEWHELDGESAKALVMLWLIASEYEGTLPEVKVLAFRLRCSEADVTRHISALEKWLERSDIAPISPVISPAISDGYQETRPEKRREETEYMSDFEVGWKSWTHHPNDNKQKASKAFTARLRAGIPVADLVAGRNRYEAWLQSEGTASRFILHTATFFGPDEHWKLPWSVPGKVPEDRAGILALASQHGIELSDDITLTAARKMLAQRSGMSL